MARIRGSNTKPEMVARRLIHSMGYPYRLHDRGLPGTPDLFFPSKRKVIFIHGCFWHRHDCKSGQSIPASNKESWQDKFSRTLARDERNHGELERDGIDVLVIWECDTKPTKLKFLKDTLIDFLES